VWKVTRRPRIFLQLGQGVRMVARLADLLAVQRGDLVGADHQRARMPPAIAAAFRAPGAGRSLRRFARQRGFVDVGRDRLEGQAQAGQQFAPVGGAGSEDQAHGSGTWYHVGQSNIHKQNK
jgi:hypothetical protein